MIFWVSMFDIEGNYLVEINLRCIILAKNRDMKNNKVVKFTLGIAFASLFFLVLVILLINLRKDLSM